MMEDFLRLARANTEKIRNMWRSWGFTGKPNKYLKEK